jgi:hypothetical protein
LLAPLPRQPSQAAPQSWKAPLKRFAVDVVPANGTCEVTRQGEVLGVSTPEHRRVTISKSQHELMFKCSAPGYHGKTESLSANLAAATVASFFLFDLGIVDAATGAWMKYPERITVVLQKA